MVSKTYWKIGENMKVVDCSIEIESRSEINVIQDMIDVYLEHNQKLYEEDKEKLLKIKNQLESMWYSW